MEILAKNIAEDLLKIGIAIDGIWDEILGGIASRFKQVEEDITTCLLSTSGFVPRIIYESKEIKIVAYEKDGSGIIHVIVYMPSGVWKSSRFLGYGTEAAGALEELESFYREGPKFSVEKS